MFTKRFAGINFRESGFVVVVIDGLQTFVVEGLGSRWAWKSAWGVGNDDWKCCHSPFFNWAWKAVKGTSYRTKESVGIFLSVAIEEGQRRRGKSAAANKPTGEERSEIKGRLWYVAKPKIKKG